MILWHDSATYTVHKSDKNYLSPLTSLMSLVHFLANSILRSSITGLKNICPEKKGKETFFSSDQLRGTNTLLQLAHSYLPCLLHLLLPLFFPLQGKTGSCFIAALTIFVSFHHVIPLPQLSRFSGIWDQFVEIHFSLFYYFKPNVDIMSKKYRIDIY